MSRKSKAVRLYDFTGGLNTKSSVTSLALNQARDLQNINILPNGGFEKRRGNTVFNSSAMDSGASVHGTGYYRQADGDDWLMAICGSKIFKSEFDGTMDDISAALTITAGNNNIWTHSVMNDLSIWVGGARATDVPIRWNGTGNAAVLGGTPPVGEFGLTGNNRFFIGNMVATPSRINWSILGNPEDWTGSGSGSQDISTNDGDSLVGAALLGYDSMLLFKQNSIHIMTIRSSPFPVYLLFRNVGAVSKRGIVEVDGIVYFITPEPRIKATDGTKIFEFPDFIDDVWDSLNSSRLQYLHGIYYRRLRQIWWFVTTTSGTTTDYCIIWDLNRKCWLRHPTGYKMNAATIARDRSIYGGAFDGKLYLQDVTNTYVDASESGAAISAYWRSGWNDFGESIEAKTIPYADINFVTQSTAGSTFEFAYGFDFSQDRKTETISMIAGGSLYDVGLYDVATYGGQTDKPYLCHMAGSGKFIQTLFRNSNANEGFSLNGFTIPIDMDEPRKI